MAISKWQTKTDPAWQSKVDPPPSVHALTRPHDPEGRGVPADAERRQGAPQDRPPTPPQPPGPPLPSSYGCLLLADRDLLGVLSMAVGDFDRAAAGDVRGLHGDRGLADARGLKNEDPRSRSRLARQLAGMKGHRRRQVEVVADDGEGLVGLHMAGRQHLGSDEGRVVEDNRTSAADSHPRPGRRGMTRSCVWAPERKAAYPLG